MTKPNGDPVTDPNAAGAGSGGEGAGGGAGSGDGTTDQEISIKVGDKDVKVKVSDILDERGVPYKQMNGELQRKLDEATSTLQQFSERDKEEEGEEGKGKAGEFVDPIDGQKYTEEDLNRMMMTGEGTKALRIVMNPKQVGRVVEGVVTAREVKAETRRRYPDLNNPKSEFFIRAAMYMQSHNLFDHPRGLALASAAVAEDMRAEGKKFTTGTFGSPEDQRRSQQDGTVIRGREGSGAPQGGGEPELDDSGKAMAAKLGVDPKAMAKRLSDYLQSRSNRRSRREED